MNPPSSSSSQSAWLPPTKNYDDDIFAADQEREELESESISFLSQQINNRLEELSKNVTPSHKTHKQAAKLARGRFMDLTESADGERILEQLVSQNIPDKQDMNVVRGSIVALQSLLIMGMQVGFKGTPAMQQKMLSHLISKHEEQKKSHHLQTSVLSDDTWDEKCIRRLKHDRDTTAALQLLASLQKKRSAQGAYDLLVALGAWNRHENLALLRSGFPTRFTEEEESAAKEATSSPRDPDCVLGLRKDLRRFKVFTIDNASTSEIDDGISIEVLTNDDGSVRQRYWIHIADADKWAPRGSKIIYAARRRATSIYLPTGSLPMFPNKISIGSMSLRANHDCYALSLGVELNSDGSINSSSIIVVPSRIRVSYRLTYDDVDDMLAEGVGYSEEWQLGAMLAAATKRRAYRSRNGSSEGKIPNPIPQAAVSVQSNITAEDEASISVFVESTHNAGMNVSSTAETTGSTTTTYASPVSPANLLVTEMMILGGEAMGKWGIRMDEKEREEKKNGDNAGGKDGLIPNELRMPFRSQSEPDLRSREREASFLEDLVKDNKGNGYCSAWYSRRFFSPVKISEDPQRHSGMGLDCYVQWTSPIRRYGDLQVHAAVKRYLRRQRINALVKSNKPIPPEIRTTDLGYPVPTMNDNDEYDSNTLHDRNNNDTSEESPIDYNDGMAQFRAGRPLQRNAQEYWMLEYIRRLMAQTPNNEVSFECVVLGCIDSQRDQYVIYVHELGLEHKYLSEIGPLEEGKTLWLRVSSVNPRMGFLTLSVTARDVGENVKAATARAA